MDYRIKRRRKDSVLVWRSHVLPYINQQLVSGELAKRSCGVLKDYHL